MYNNYNISPKILSKIKQFCCELTDWNNKRDYYIKIFLPDIFDYKFDGLSTSGRALFLEIRKESSVDEWNNLIDIIIDVKDAESNYSPSSYNNSTSSKTTTNNKKQTGNSSTSYSFSTNQNGSIKLGKKIAEGGEGKIYNVVGKPDLLAKIYFPEKLNKDKIEKVKIMCKMNNPQIAKFSATPQMPLYKSGQFVGFVMNKVTDSKHIRLLYNVMDKKKHFKNADYRFMVRAAKNLAIAIETLHENSIIIGDINELNIFVNDQALIKLIDCDSYQIEYGGKHYLCGVGLGEFTPPELHGNKLSNILRTQNHDCFGLAIMIFKLLVFAKHPYSGINAPSAVEDSIMQNCFCFARNSIMSNPTSAQWNYEQIYSMLTDEIKDLFERAFAINANSRPSAHEWKIALEHFEKGLTVCPSGHIYHKSNSSCKWCDLCLRKKFNPFGTKFIKRSKKTTNSSGSSNYNRSNNNSYSSTYSSSSSNTINNTNYPHDNYCKGKYSSGQNSYSSSGSSSGGTSNNYTSPKVSNNNIPTNQDDGSGCLGTIVIFVIIAFIIGMFRSCSDSTLTPVPQVQEQTIEKENKTNDNEVQSNSNENKTEEPKADNFQKIEVLKDAQPHPETETKPVTKTQSAKAIQTVPSLTTKSQKATNSTPSYTQKPKITVPAVNPPKPVEKTDMEKSSDYFFE